MSTDLLKDYFARDLSEAEMRRLSAQLEDGEDNALRFAALAEAAFVALRIPHGPGSQGGPAAGHGLGATIKGLGAAAKALVLLAGGTATVLAVAWHARHRHPPETPAVAPAAAAPKAVALAVPGFASLGIDVGLPQRGLVTVTVLDRKGTEVALIFAGVLDAGGRRFNWNGRLANGSPARPGSYRIRVKSGPVEQDREIVIRKP
jgi:hypothetical protein